MEEIARLTPGRPYEKIDTFGQFLEHDREVLRFYGYWDDSDTAFGDVHDMILHYFLADDTIEGNFTRLPVQTWGDKRPLGVDSSRF